MGVAESVSTSTPLLQKLIFFFMGHAKARRSHQRIRSQRKPHRLKATVSMINADFSPPQIFQAPAPYGDLKTRYPSRDRKRKIPEPFLRNVLRCWRASSVVGTSTATKLPSHMAYLSCAHRDLRLAVANVPKSSLSITFGRIPVSAFDLLLRFRCPSVCFIFKASSKLFCQTVSSENARALWFRNAARIKDPQDQTPARRGDSRAFVFSSLTHLPPSFSCGGASSLPIYFTR